MLALQLILMALLLIAATKEANASPSPINDVAQRTVRCDFPGILINKSSRDMLVQYDNGSTATNVTVQPGHQTTEYTCDADFVYPLGYNFITSNVKGPKAGFYNVPSGGVFKMDAYTFECYDGAGCDVTCLSTYNGNQ
ncbi:unnamed protein product [Sympodiomycopsis kandeliae]